ncbi:hypothetical protein [Flavisolibacter ginsenosidimutans]
MKRFLFFSLSLNLCLFASAQENFSAATGVSLLHNFSPRQQFNAVGHTIHLSAHFSPTQSAYAWVEYYTEGKFKNDFIATAKSPLLSPQQIALVATGRLAYRHFSIGWKHYFKGSYSNDNSVNVYGLAGFGFLFATVSNTFSTNVDTTQYSLATASGSGTVRKLTFDVGLGAERSLAGNIYLFADVRSWLPASSNPSPYLHNQRNVPLPFMLSAGLRILLGSVD